MNTSKIQNQGPKASQKLPRTITFDDGATYEYKTKAKQQPSPLPWYCDINDFTVLSDKVNTYGNFHVAIVARDFLDAASETDKAQAQANLKLIVASVNNAGKLAEALRLLLADHIAMSKERVKPNRGRGWEELPVQRTARKALDEYSN